ncbi:MAG TPA: SIS domain-containing protein [Solirubrobacteraceae bacterium]|nr:SIS domain-containing protein [Solirubrobacteraceae bacterium]
MATQLQQMIEAQPAALRAVAGLDVAAFAERLSGARRVHVVGTGTSFHAAELGALLLERGGVRAIATPSADFARWRPEPAADEAVILISHTGTTPYALTVRERARSGGVPLVGIAGERSGWDEAILTPTHERSETYTVSYTAALGVLALLADALAGTGTGPDALRGAAADVERVIATPDVERVDPPRRALAIVGPGPWGVTAREGALKLRESSHVLAEGFDAERLLHGAAVPYGSDDVLIALEPAADSDGLTGAVAAAGEAAGMTTFVFEDAGRSQDPFIAQISATARLQLLASHMSARNRTDPDTAIVGPWAAEPMWALGGP